MTFLKFMITLVMAASWHLWRIATLRPAFDNLKPAWLTVGVFVSLAFTASIARAYFGGHSEVGAVLGVSLVVAMQHVFFRVALSPLATAPQKSRTPLGFHWVLIVALLGESAVIDLATIVAFLVWDFPLYGWFWSLLDASVISIMCVQFGRWAKQRRALDEAVT